MGKKPKWMQIAEDTAKAWIEEETIQAYLKKAEDEEMTDDEGYTFLEIHDEMWDEWLDNVPENLKEYANDNWYDGIYDAMRGHFFETLEKLAKEKGVV